MEKSVHHKEEEDGEDTVIIFNKHTKTFEIPDNAKSGPVKEVIIPSRKGSRKISGTVFNDLIREDSPERDVRSSQEVIRLPARRVTKRQVQESVSFKSRLTLIASIALTTIITLVVLCFAIAQVVTITKDGTLSNEQKRADILIYLNIISFIVGIYLPGPLNNFKIKREKKKD